MDDSFGCCAEIDANGKYYCWEFRDAETEYDMTQIADALQSVTLTLAAMPGSINFVDDMVETFYDDYEGEVYYDDYDPHKQAVYQQAVHQHAAHQRVAQQAAHQKAVQQAATATVTTSNHSQSHTPKHEHEHSQSHTQPGYSEQPHSLMAEPGPDGREQWYYKDPSGQEQCPFDKEQMAQWFGDGYLPKDLPIRCNESTPAPFVELKHWFCQGADPAGVAADDGRCGHQPHAAAYPPAMC